ncbi:MAG: HD domain-containing protein [Gammaproteobacteria bacterium]|uniref:HD-GYP domain-containing protein n=1 Tax=Rhodoferax sp. TaxID=50421 RepID=UPI0017AD31B7|nr:HD domain-containing phosphohydrolase [Rhodoferax sp.]MBA3057970.1 HD domain-containing protein [Rhodoferax sp.]MBU3899753.1 HD domain-containing protein [Gammaproteobacteria bacterium]MBU4080080.1 HD domain-containing protein [Gammaproteobacteria bacterium]
MMDIETDPKHFIKAVTELGEKRPVLTTQAIFNDRGVKIIEKGVQVNAGLYERLMAHKLNVPLEQSVASTPTVTGALLRRQAEEVMRDVPFFERIAANPKTRNLLLDALTKLPLPDPIAFQLTLAYEVRPILFRHSVLMALFAAWMTQGMLVSRFDVSVASAAGLLHDIGMQHLDPVLLAPQSVIDRDQRRQLYSHPLVSTLLIERHHEYPRELLRAVREHHEFLDGSGYPGNLGGDAISPLGRILSLGELVTSLLASNEPACELRLRVLLRMNGHRYDAALVERVMQNTEPQTEGQSKGLAVMADPVNRLLEIDAILSAWPCELAGHADLSAARRDNLAAVAAQSAQLRRTLAAVGVAPQQLAQLGSEALDEFLQLELSLLVQESTWQLRSLARQTRRRWRLEADARYPDALQFWLDRADTLVASISGTAPVQLRVME